MHTILPQLALTEYDQWLLDTLPRQGSWTVDDYLGISDRSEIPVEYNRGTLEFLPIPTDKQHTVLRYLFLALYGFIEPRGDTATSVVLPAFQVEVSAVFDAK